MIPFEIRALIWRNTKRSKWLLEHSYKQCFFAGAKWGAIFGAIATTLFVMASWKSEVSLLELVAVAIACHISLSLTMGVIGGLSVMVLKSINRLTKDSPPV